MARLDAADDQLTAINYAATTVQIAFDDFYLKLNNDQRARFEFAQRADCHIPKVTSTRFVRLSNCDNARSPITERIFDIRDSADKKRGEIRSR